MNRLLAPITHLVVEMGTQLFFIRRICATIIDDQAEYLLRTPWLWHNFFGCFNKQNLIV